MSFWLLRQHRVVRQKPRENTKSRWKKKDNSLVLQLRICLYLAITVFSPCLWPSTKKSHLYNVAMIKRFTIFTIFFDTPCKTKCKVLQINGLDQIELHTGEFCANITLFCCHFPNKGKFRWLKILIERQEQQFFI